MSSLVRRSLWVCRPSSWPFRQSDGAWSVSLDLLRVISSASLWKLQSSWTHNQTILRSILPLVPISSQKFDDCVMKILNNKEMFHISFYFMRDRFSETFFFFNNLIFFGRCLSAAVVYPVKILLEGLIRIRFRSWYYFLAPWVSSRYRKTCAIARFNGI